MTKPPLNGYMVKLLRGEMGHRVQVAAQIALEILWDILRLPGAALANLYPRRSTKRRGGQIWIQPCRQP